MNHWAIGKKLIAPFLAVSALTLGLGLVGYLGSNALWNMMTGQVPAVHGGISGAAETRLDNLADANATVATSATKADASLTTTRKYLSLSALFFGVALILFLGFAIPPPPGRKSFPPRAIPLSREPTRAPRPVN